MNTKTKILIALAEVCGETLTDSRLKAYLFAVNDLTLEEFQRAFKVLMADETLFKLPMPGKFRRAARPQLSSRQEAIQVLDRVKKAVVKFGWPNANDARVWLGDQAWDFVERTGGWSKLCESPDLNINDSTIYAQMRDACESQLSASRTGIKYDELPTHEKPPELNSEVLKLLKAND